jgi:hypothetical protein
MQTSYYEAEREKKNTIIIIIIIIIIMPSKIKTHKANRMIMFYNTCIQLTPCSTCRLIVGNKKTRLETPHIILAG